MSKRHKSVIQFIEGVKSRKDRMRSPDGSNKSWQDLIYKGYQNKSSSIQAKTAFMDIAEDLYETNPELALKVYQTLYKSGSIPNVGSIQKEGFWKIGGRGNQLHDVIDEGFPSGYEGGNNERNAHMQLLAVLQKNIAKFGGQDIDEIAEQIYGFAEVFDEGGGVPNIVLTKKELKENNIRREDVQESMRYLIIAPRKKGMETTFYPSKEMRDTYGELGKGIEALKKMDEEMRKNDSGSSMWAAVVPASSGNGVDIVVMSGIKGDRYKSRMVGRIYEEGYENGDYVSRQLSYDNRKMFGMFKTWRNGQFMDTENDFWERHTLKERIGEYYNNGPVPGRTHIPYWFAREVMDPGEYEYNNIIKPFHEKNRELSDSDYAKEWEKVMDETTYTMRDRFFDFFNADLPTHEGFHGKENPAMGDINKALDRTEASIKKEEKKYDQMHEIKFLTGQRDIAVEKIQRLQAELDHEGASL